MLGALMFAAVAGANAWALVSEFGQLKTYEKFWLGGNALVLFVIAYGISCFV